MEVRVIKFKKSFPFFYIYKREEYIMERLSRQYNEIISLYPIIIFYKIVRVFNRGKLHEKELKEM